MAGERILASAPALSNVASLVRSSHERWDGGGYPDGLKGDDIPLEASIVSVCDAFSAMTTATAFGSLWASQSPGLSSMGKLMALALISTMAAAVLFQPVLMGPPRKSGKPESDATLARQGDPNHRAGNAAVPAFAEGMRRPFTWYQQCQAKAQAKS